MAADVDERQDDDEFLAFWEQHRAEQEQPTTRILGVDVVVPTDLPLEVEDLASQLHDSGRREDFERLLGILFGPDTFEQWKRNGLTSRMLRVLVAWGFANANGRSVSFAEAADLVDKAEALKAERDAAGKATGPNRAARRASSKTRASAGTGRSSSRTSAANTASRRTR